MSTHFSTSRPNAARQARDFRKNRFLLVPFLGIGIALVILFCPLTKNTHSTMAGTSMAAQTAIVSSINQGFWHTEWNSIIDVNGSSIRISGVNWSGFETANMVPGGLRVQDYRSILREIRAAGYNTVRVPFSNQMVETPIVPSDIRFENAVGDAINQDLIDLDAMRILDHIIDAAGQAGLKVILDNHRSEAGSSAEENGLWYTGQYPESSWIADWMTLAVRYKGNSTVVGFDLRNEPHNANQGGSCWSCGGATDWHLAAQRAGDAILRINPGLLIFVEGTDTVDTESDFWGGNLAGVRTAPVHLSIPGRLVYSVHVYGPAEYQQNWFNASTTAASLSALYHRHWGFISESGIAPVWIGEFGTPNSDADVSSAEAGSEGQWFQALVAYLGSHSDIGWSYWSINGEDRYGLLGVSYSATPANALKAKALASIRFSGLNGFMTASSFTQSSPTPGAFVVPPAPKVIYGPAFPSPAARVKGKADVRRDISAESVVENAIAKQVHRATVRALNNLPRD